MSHENIIRAWKDEEYRMSLTEEERAQLPENPAGLIELMDEEMVYVGGGYDPRDTPLDICDEVTPEDPCILTPKCPSTDGGCVPLPEPPDFW